MLAETWRLDEISQAPLGQLTWYHLFANAAQMSESM
jgi:hypothetical protein